MVMSIAFSPDGSQLASGGGEDDFESGVVKIFDTKTWKQVKNLEGHSHNRVKVAYSPDGRFFASASWDLLVIIRDANTWERLQSPIKVSGAFITGLACSPNGERLATVGMGGSVIVWDTTTRQEVCRFLGHKTAVWSVAFSPKGDRAASCGDDGTVRIWDPVTGQEALTLRGHTDPALCVAFSPDGNHIASSSKDGTVKVWDGSLWAEISPTNSTQMQMQSPRSGP
jgi:WD40 repeat protein